MWPTPKASKGGIVKFTERPDFGTPVFHVDYELPNSPVYTLIEAMPGAFLAHRSTLHECPPVYLVDDETVLILSTYRYRIEGPCRKDPEVLRLVREEP